MDVLKTIAIDVTRTVFDNDTDGIMYITKDIYNDTYVIAVPVITFSWTIWKDNKERDYNDLASANIFGDKDKQTRLIQAIKDGINAFEG